MDAAQIQLFLGAVPGPRPLAGSAGNITTLGVSTECGPVQGAGRECRCLPGYEWNGVVCGQYAACGTLLLSPCSCLRWTAETPGYCQPPLPSTTAASLGAREASRKRSETLACTASPTSGSQLIPAGGDLTISFSLGAGATEVTWYLLSPDGSLAREIRNGTQTMLVTNGSVAVLRVSSISADWAGEYICRYVYENSQLQLRQQVSVSLGPEDIVPTPAQVSMNCSSSGGITLRCCIRNRGKAYRVSWVPGSRAPADLVGDTDPLCHSLPLETCPAQDTSYQCVFESEGLGAAQAVVTVSVIQAGDPFCPSNDSQGTWTATKVGQVAEISCPDNRAGTVQRSCSAGGVWGEVITKCTNGELLAGLRSAQLVLAGMGNPRSELAQLIEWLGAETQPGRGSVSSASDLLALVTTVDTISRIAGDAGLHLSNSTMATFLAVVSQMLDFDPQALWAKAQADVPSVASTFLQSIENITRRPVPTDGNFSFTLPNVELQGAVFGPDSLTDYSKTFHGQPLLQAHISQEVLEQLVQLGANVTVTSMALKTLGGLLPANYGPGLGSSNYVLGSLLLSSSIMSRNGSVSQAEIAMTFGHRNERPQCVFWDHGLFQGEGGWSSQGCQTSGTGTTTKCTCQHLTSFSVLMSIHSITDSFWLDFLSQFGVCASILALILCLGIYYLVWRLVVRNKISYFRYMTLVNIALSLLMANAWFLGSTWMTPSHENELCVAATFFTHFFYLAMFFWMLVQALMLFHHLVFVFHQLARASVTPLLVTIGYLCPLLIAAADIAVYYPKRGYVQATACWLNGHNGAIYAFSVPVLVIVLVNVLILFVVVMKLMRPSLSEGPKGEERKTLISILKALLILTPIFGLTWGLGVITMTSKSSDLSHYVFAALNSFQGVSILVFGCLMDKKVRDALLERIQKELTSMATTAQAGELQEEVVRPRSSREHEELRTGGDR
ncbi:adhesion G-protein coupled receptor F3 [Malaclemys terrapin pileata]|uniref:adhesion G-protein coupled receptor F3 n=1 Tax=Malaclemys terrapin pileata TaxID=2991368 RepID=UPI0023A7C05A|nr:adhesion G-protein coupled receptor F3 [Malaclemys terrapin pileata]